MRSLILLLALVVPTLADGHSISDEFAGGFGGVSWGMKLDDLINQFPGGYQVFSTAPGGIAYVLNIEDPVLGISRHGLYVSYGIDPAGAVEGIEIQIPYDQARQLVATISTKFGPVIGPESRALVLIYHWPTDAGIALGLRMSSAGAHRFATLSIRKQIAKRSVAPKPKTA